MNDKRRVISVCLAAIMLVSLCAACASTSVAAESSNIVGTQAPAGEMSFGPTILHVDATSARFLFATKGTTLYYKRNLEPWKAFEGASSSAASAVNMRGQIIDVVVRGMNGNIYWKHSEDNGAHWTGWKTIGYNVFVYPGTAPILSYADSTGFSMWYVDGSRHLMHSAHWYGSDGWLRPKNIGGNTICTSTPGAALTGGLKMCHCLVRGSNGRLLDCYSTNNGDSWAWRDCGEYLYAPRGASWGFGPAVCSRGTSSGAYDVFWVDSNLHPWHKQWTDGGKFFSAPSRYPFEGTTYTTPSCYFDASVAAGAQPTVHLLSKGGNLLGYEKVGTLPNRDYILTQARWSGWQGPISGPA